MLQAVFNRKTTDYLLIYLLIAVSAFPFFCTSQINYIILFFLSLYFYLKRSVKFDPRMLIILGVFAGVEFFQFLLIHPYDPMIIPSTQIRVAVGYFVLSLTRKNFVNYYINIIYVLSIIGFFFFIPSQISPAFFNFFKNNTTAPFEPPFAAKDGFYNIWPTNISIASMTAC